MVTTASGKKNLKRNIETKTKDFKFINHGKEILVYPVSLKVEDLVILFHEARTHLTKFENMDSKEKTVLRSENIIREEIKGLDYKMPWPPGPDNLKMSNFNNPPHLDSFLSMLLAGNVNTPLSNRVTCLKSSFGQDLTYAGKYFYNI